MATGQQIFDLARKHIGEKYVNRQVPKDDPNWSGPWDCAEFMSWLVYQEAGILYGCTDNSDPPAKADAYTGAWKRDSLAIGQRISVEEAAGTVGAFLLRYPPSAGEMGHIAVSDGKGGTVEAKGKAFGVVADTVKGRRWDTGVKVPNIDYGAMSGAALELFGPSALYRLDAPNMNPAKITEIQRALLAGGIDPGPIDGQFGPATAAAVAAFQDKLGLVVDGEVGNDTAKALGINLIETAVQVLSSTEGKNVLSPLIAIAAGILPDIIKAIAGARGKTVERDVVKAVTDVTRTSDPVAAQQALKSTPAAAVELQLRLAAIALEEERLRQQAQVEVARAQADRDVQTAKSDLENTDSARKWAAEFARSGGPMAWGAPLVSLVVTVGFFAILIVLMNIDLTKEDTTLQIINITVGALAAAFATVVNFWLGSSQGSRNKDAANVGLQMEQAQRTTELIREQASTIEAVRQQGSTSHSDGAAGPAAQKPSNFQNCVDIVLLHEGGFSDHAADPGGATQFGITLATLKEWRDDDKLTAADVRKLEKGEACEIYRTRYWNVLRCDDLPAGVDLVVFDVGVNAGPSRSAKFLQKAVGAETDGSIGPATVAATKAADPKTVVSKMSDRRLEFYKSLATWPDFGKGWTNRTEAVRASALKMIQG